jgi:glycosyltransferase involved in cell wall biosynthesis
MREPTISVIIVSYNAAKHLRSCLERIRQQHCDDLQLIIIDGGSKDGTTDIIVEYGDLVDYWISEPDKGIYDAMNKGIDHIKGKWVLFLGADDLLEDGFKSMIAELTIPSAIYYGMVNVNKVIYKDEYSAYRLAKLNICHQAIFYPSSVFRKYRYNLKYPVWADWFLNIQCWNDSSFPFVYKGHLIATFGLDGISSTIPDLQFQKDRRKIVLQYLGLPVLIRLVFRDLKLMLYRGRSKDD